MANRLMDNAASLVAHFRHMNYAHLFTTFTLKLVAIFTVFGVSVFCLYSANQYFSAGNNQAGWANSFSGVFTMFTAYLSFVKTVLGHPEEATKEKEPQRPTGNKQNRNSKKNNKKN